MKNKSTAIILAFCLGGVGVHQYYLGNKTKGILYTAFCITFVPAFLALFDLIILASMSDNEFHQKYNANFIDHSEEDMMKLNRLEKIYDLKEKGVLSEAEFEKEKRKIAA